MKHHHPARLSHVVTLTLVLAAGCVRAQETDPHAADRAALRELAARYEKAVASGKVDDIAPFLAKDFTAVTVTGEEVKSAADFQKFADKIQGLLKGGKHSMKLTPEPAQFEGDLVVCRGTTDEVATTGDGETFPFHSFFTAVLRREDGGFRIVRVQATMDPIQNPFVAAITSAARTTGLAMGGLIGLIVGALGMRLLKR